MASLSAAPLSAVPSNSSLPRPVPPSTLQPQLQHSSPTLWPPPSTPTGLRAEPSYIGIGIPERCSSGVGIVTPNSPPPPSQASSGRWSQFGPTAANGVRAQVAVPRGGSVVRVLSPASAGGANRSCRLTAAAPDLYPGFPA